MPSALIKGLLFDLDGTLLDSAPDLTMALNRVRAGFGLEPVAVTVVRKGVSRGASGMLELGLPGVGGSDLERARGEFLQHYAELGVHHSEEYPGISDMLTMIDAANMPWGIVTNKSAALTMPIVRQLGWDRRAASVVCGDTAAAAKPSPLPVLLAAQQLRVNPRNVLMIGDDVRDLEAGKAANCSTAAVAWGYGGADQFASNMANYIYNNINDMCEHIKLILDNDQA